MKRSVVFLHGNPPKADFVKQHMKEDDVIICADGGTGYAFNLGLKPHIVIGDFDSLSKKFKARLVKENIPMQTFPREKDETDSELVLRYVVEQGFTDIIIFGWMGSRLDHALANLFLFGNVKKNIQVRIVELDQVLYLVHSLLKLNGKKGELVSLLPLNGDVSGVSTKGLKWALKNETLHYGKTRGISNEFVGKTAEIRVKKGMLLVIQMY